MNISNLIIENIANPHELERMYRKEPEAFKKSVSYAWEKNHDSISKRQQIQKKLPCYRKISYPWVF